jgi:hypothetical protein
VERPAPGAHGLGQYTLLPGAGAGPIERIDYRDGSACILHPSKLYDGPGCAPVGQVLAQARRPSAAEVASPVTAHVDGRDIVVSFTARVAVTDARSAYVVDLRLPGRSHGINCGASEGGPLIRDVAAGAREEFRLPTQGCKGHFSGEVTLESNNGPVAGFSPGTGGRSLEVGAFSLDVK